MRKSNTRIPESSIKKRRYKTEFAKPDTRVDCTEFEQTRKGGRTPCGGELYGVDISRLVDETSRPSPDEERVRSAYLDAVSISPSSVEPPRPTSARESLSSRNTRVGASSARHVPRSARSTCRCRPFVLPCLCSCAPTPSRGHNLTLRTTIRRPGWSTICNIIYI